MPIERKTGDVTVILPDHDIPIKEEIVTKGMRDRISGFSAMFYDDPKPSDSVQLAILLHKLIDKVDELNRKFDLVFGGHVLIDGKIINIDKLMEKE